MGSAPPKLSKFSPVMGSKVNVDTKDWKKYVKYVFIVSLYIYHFSTEIDFSSEKYSGSTGHRNSWYQ